MTCRDQPVTFSAVAAAAGVSRAWLYRNPGIRDLITRLRSEPRRTTSTPAAQRATAESLRARLDALAQLDRPERLSRAERLELNLLQRNAPAAAIGTPTIPEFFSARVGCKTFQPLFFGVDLADLCLRT